MTSPIILFTETGENSRKIYILKMTKNHLNASDFLAFLEYLKIMTLLLTSLLGSGYSTQQDLIQDSLETSYCSPV